MDTGSRHLIRLPEEIAAVILYLTSDDAAQPSALMEE